MKQHTRRYYALPWYLRASLACLCTLLALGCSPKNSDAKRTADPSENALESGEAAKAARAAITGQWRWSPTTHDRVDLADAEIDLLNGIDKATRAGFAFHKDGTFRIGARLSDQNLHQKTGTWDVQDVELKGFSVTLNFEGESDAKILTVTPRPDGNLDAELEQRQFVLRKAPIDGYLKKTKPSDASETSDDP